MVESRKILFVCHRARDLALLPRDPCTVASPDPGVLQAAHDLPRIESVVPLEPSWSLPQLWPEVRRLTGILNDWLAEVAGDCPHEVTRWPLWVEGGYTTQKLFDIALLVRACEQLLNGVSSVFLAPGDSQVDEVLQEVATQAGASVNIVGSPPRRILRSRWFAAGADTWPVRLGIPLWSFFKRVRLRWRVARAPRARRIDRKFVILLASPLAKHAENARVLVEPFQARGFEALILTWGNPVPDPGATPAVESARLESWARAGISRVRRRHRVLSNRIRDAWRTAPPTLEVGGVNLVPLLTPWIDAFAGYELLERMLQYEGLLAFSRAHRITLARTWGFGVLPLGRLYAAAAVEAGARPFVFQNLIGTDIYAYETKCNDACDLVLVTGEHEIEMARASGVDASKLRVGGFPRGSAIEAFRRGVSPGDSRWALGIPGTRTRTLAYFSSGVSRGYVSMSEHVQVLEFLVRFATSHPGWQIIAKPHPSEEMRYWRFADALPENFTLAPAGTNPYHCVNAADGVLVKFSTIAFEAMEFERPVISLSLDGDPRSQMTLEGGAETFADLAPLEGLLVSLEEEAAFVAWRADALERQGRFLPRKFHRPAVPVGDHIADVVLTEFASRDGRHA